VQEGGSTITATHGGNASGLVTKGGLSSPFFPAHMRTESASKQSDQPDVASAKAEDDRDFSRDADVRLNFMLTKAFQAASETSNESDGEKEELDYGRSVNKKGEFEEVDPQDDQEEVCDDWEVDHAVVFDNGQLAGLARLLVSVNEEARSSALANMSEENRWTMLRAMNAASQEQCATAAGEGPWTAWAKDKAAGARIGLAHAKERVAIPADWGGLYVHPKVSEYGAKAIGAAGSAAGLAKQGFVAARTALWETRAQNSRADAESFTPRRPRDSRTVIEEVPEIFPPRGRKAVLEDVSNGVAVLRAHAEAVMAAGSPFRAERSPFRAEPGSRRRSRSCGVVS